MIFGRSLFHQLLLFTDFDFENLFLMNFWFKQGMTAT